MKNGRTTEFLTRETVLNEGARVTDDPRVDSPEIKVIFPPEELIRDTEESGENIEQNFANEPVITSDPDIPTPPEDEKDHVCEVGILKAVQQNWIVLSITGLALIGIGYLIGKSR